MKQADIAKTLIAINRLLLRISMVRGEIDELKHKREQLLKTVRAEVI